MPAAALYLGSLTSMTAAEGGWGRETVSRDKRRLMSGIDNGYRGKNVKCLYVLLCGVVKTFINFSEKKYI